MNKLTVQELKEKLTQLKPGLILIVSNDLTTWRIAKAEIGRVNDLGVLGFAFTLIKGLLKGFEWLKINGNYLFNEISSETAQRFSEYFTHVELSERRVKFKELMERI